MRGSWRSGVHGLKRGRQRPFMGIFSSSRGISKIGNLERAEDSRFGSKWALKLLTDWRVMVM